MFFKLNDISRKDANNALLSCSDIINSFEFRIKFKTVIQNGQFRIKISHIAIISIYTGIARRERS